MSEEYASYEEKRRHLIADITRQRGELADAYRNLEKPIHYAEYGLRGFGFLRKNSWVFVAVPAALKVTTVLLGLVRGKSAPAPLFSGQRQRQHKHAEREKPHGLLGHGLYWAGHGFRLFRLYRRFRRYFL